MRPDPFTLRILILQKKEKGKLSLQGIDDGTWMGEISITQLHWAAASAKANESFTAGGFSKARSAQTYSSKTPAYAACLCDRSVAKSFLHPSSCPRTFDTRDETKSLCYRKIRIKQRG